MREKRGRGSVTIFAALSLMLTAQLVFALLEGARNADFHEILQMNTDAALESVFAEYVSPLWETYRLLGWSAADMDGEFSLARREDALCRLAGDSLGSRRAEPLAGSCLFHAEVEDAVFTEYLLMTDQQGKVFRSAAAAYMKNNLTYEAAQAIRDIYTSAGDEKKKHKGSDISIGGALDALDRLKESGEEAVPVEVSSVELRRTDKTADMAASGAAEAGAGASSGNLLTTVMEAKEKGILSLVLPESAVVSEEEIVSADVVSHRTLQQGSGQKLPEGGWYENILFNQYLLRCLSAYTDQSDAKGLRYELEYLLGGKPSDAQNLKIAAAELLAIREAMNLASLLTMSDKTAEALALACLLAGAAANPVIVEAVKYGILAAWAFAESVLDLRTLLAGRTVALVKSEADWTSDLDAIPALLSGQSEAKSCEHGISYKNYLGMLLYLGNVDRIAMRAMDVEESAVRSVEGYHMFRMDCVVCQGKVRLDYSFRPVFSEFVTLAGRTPERFQVETTAQYSYLARIQE